jgi:hypothetical protein
MKWVLIVMGTLAALFVLMAIVGLCVAREHRATSTVTLRRPPETVWQALQEIGGAGFDLPVIVLESSAPRKLVTQIDPKVKAPFGGTWTFELTSEASGTRVTVTETGWVSNPIFRFMSRFLFGYYGSLDKHLKALGKRLGEAVQPTHS